MKMFIRLLVLFALTLSLLPTQVSAQAADPVQVVKNYIAAANTGNFDNALAFYTDDAIVKNGLGLFVGKEQVAGWLEQDVQTTRAVPQVFQATGNMVVNTGTVTLARFKAISIDPLQYRSEYVIENDKIRFFSPVVLLTPGQQAKVQAAGTNAAAQPAANGSGPDPAQIAKDYIATANTGDYAKTLAFYADNAIVKNGLGLFVGKDQIASWLKQDVLTTRADPLTFQNTANMVVNTGTVSLMRFQKLGIDSVQYRAEYVIENGKIRYFSPVVCWLPSLSALILPAKSCQSRQCLTAWNRFSDGRCFRLGQGNFILAPLGIPNLAVTAM